MKSKNRKAKYSISLRIAAVLALCACVMCGCSKIEGSDTSAGANATTPTQQTTSQSEKPTDGTTLSNESTQTESSGKKTAKTTTKASQSGKQSGTAASTSKSSKPSETNSSVQTTAPATTSSAQQTQSKAANATVTSRITSAGSPGSESRKVTEKTPEKTQTEYHIYADGYVTKYDELKLKNLTRAQRKAYDSLSEGIWKMQKDIKIPAKTIKQDEASDFLYTVLNTMPEVNYVTGTFRVTVSGGYVNKYTIDYSLSTEKARDEHKALRQVASRIIGSLDADMTDIEKVKVFHDYIIKHCEYSKAGGKSSYTAYGCLVEGKAVCEGYAMAMDYLCEKAGIYTLLISGESSNGSGKTLTHIWNKIQIDGKWYNFDVTWDDPISSFGADYVRYDYFGVTDKDLEQTHKVEKNRFGYYPVADSIAENYFRKSGTYIESYDEAEQALINAFVMTLDEGQVATSVRCADKGLFEEINTLVMSSDDETGEHTVSRYLRAACERTGKNREYSGFYTVKNERLNVIAIILK